MFYNDELGIKYWRNKISKSNTTPRVFKGWCYGKYFIHFDGSSWVNRDGNRNVPYLNKNDSKRNLNLNWFDNDWNDYWRFLTVRKFIRFSLNFC